MPLLTSKKQCTKAPEANGIKSNLKVKQGYTCKPCGELYKEGAAAGTGPWMSSLQANTAWHGMFSTGLDKDCVL